MQKKGKRKGYWFLLWFFLKIAFLVGAGYLLLLYVIFPARLAGNNMFPMLKDGDLCIFFRLDEVGTGDIVFYETKDGKTHVGRVIAFGGQTIDFPENGGYLVNGYETAEELPYETYAAEKSMVSYPLELKEDEWFIMNDYRSDTKDSRMYGPIKTDEIKGKILYMMRRRGF